MRSIRIPATTLLLVAAACVKAPPTTAPEIEIEPPATWTAASSEPAEPVAEWWDAFGDPSLASLIRLALEDNVDLVAAAARVDRALAEARIAGANLRPRVGVGVNGRYQRFNPATFGQAGAPAVTFDAYGLALDVSWEVDLWGRLRAGARSSLARAQAVEADRGAAALSLAGLVAKTWFAVAEAQAQVELAGSSAARFRASAEWIRERYEQGIRPPLDLRLALSNQAAAEALLEARLEQLDRAVRQLEVLLARYPAARLLEDFPVAGLPELPEPPPAGLPARIVSRRPDLVAAERRLVAGEESLKAARRALYPRLALTGSGGTLALQIGDLLDGDFGVWSLAAGLTQPLFEGGRLRAEVERADAGRDEALALYVGAVLEAYREVESALAAEGLLRRRAGAVEETARQTVAAQRLSEQRYAQGVGDYLVVLESQTRALTARSELLAVRRALLTNRVDLHLALGGGFAYDAPDDDDASIDTTARTVEDRSR